MLSFFKKNPSEKLKKEHAKLLERAMHAQRNGDIRGYSELSEQAQSILDKLDELEQKAG